VVGIDRHPWALGEASATYRSFGLTAQTHQGDVATAQLPKGPACILAAFTVNELPDDARDGMLQRLLERASQGDRVLVVEPIARFVARWWGGWRQAFEQAGGRADEWRIRAELPAIVKKLDRAAGLDHREMTGRSLWLDGRRDRPSQSSSFSTGQQLTIRSFGTPASRACAIAVSAYCNSDV
jgi:hypothetical protein